MMEPDFVVYAHVITALIRSSRARARMSNRQTKNNDKNHNNNNNNNNKDDEAEEGHQLLVKLFAELQSKKGPFWRGKMTNKLLFKMKKELQSSMFSSKQELLQELDRVESQATTYYKYGKLIQ